MQAQKGDDNWFPDIFRGEAGETLKAHVAEDGGDPGECVRCTSQATGTGENGGPRRSALLPFTILFLVIKPNNCACLFY